MHSAAVVVGTALPVSTALMARPMTPAGDASLACDMRASTHAEQSRMSRDLSRPITDPLKTIRR